MAVIDRKWRGESADVPESRASAGAARQRLAEADRRREAHIRHHVVERTSGQIRDLAVAVDGDAVVLSGRSETFYAKQLAQHAALPLADGLSLVNEIEVA